MTVDSSQRLSSKLTRLLRVAKVWQTKADRYFMHGPHSSEQRFAEQIAVYLRFVFVFVLRTTQLNSEVPVKQSHYYGL